MVALIALAALGALALLGVGVAAFFFLRSDEGKKAVTAVGRGVKIAHDAQNAPGAAELRQLGCQSALIMDLDDIAKSFDPDRNRNSRRMLYITCLVPFGVRTVPACDDAASEYVRAVGGTARSQFVVVVQKPFQSKPFCSELFDPQGASLGPFGAGPASPAHSGSTGEPSP